MRFPDSLHLVAEESETEQPVWRDRRGDARTAELFQDVVGEGSLTEVCLGT